MLATAKHFLGYGMADGGRNIGAVQLGERELLEVYARPFGAAIAEAGLESVMCAYSDVNGEPAAASRRLLTDMLRGALGFDGPDRRRLRRGERAVHTRQQTATDAADAGVQALAAGLDVELPGSLCYKAGVAQAVRDGVLDEAVVDRSVRRVLDAKFRLGLFENPYGDVDAFAATTDGSGAPRRTAIGSPDRHPIDRAAGQPEGRPAPAPRPGARRGDRPERASRSATCSAATRRRSRSR